MGYSDNCTADSHFTLTGGRRVQMFLGFTMVFHAVFSAYLTIIIGLVLAVLTILAGRTDVSMSLYAVALMSILDVSGGILVLTLWQNRKEESTYVDKFERIEASETEEITDLRYSFIIGLFMLTMGIFLILDSLKTLFDEDVTASTDKDIGIVSTSIGFSLAFFLAMYKYEVGHKLKSMTITADATNSLCSGLTSLSALAVNFLNPYFWWADSGTGGLVSLFTLYKGATTMMHSMRSLKELQDDRKRCAYFNSTNAQLEPGKYDEMIPASYQRVGMSVATVLKAEEVSLLYSHGV